MFLDEKYVESAAYHEAAHTVVAVALEMPLRNRGVHMDTIGCGISYYWFRLPGDPNNTPDDVLERERTIISSYAGYIAQKKFYPECPPAGSWFDSDQSIKLLDEMYPNRDEWFAVQQKLYAEAVRLVDLHWQAIEGLAKALLAQPLVLRADDPERRWSEDVMERWLDGSSVVSILSALDLKPVIRVDSAGKFFPSSTPGAVV